MPGRRRGDNPQRHVEGQLSFDDAFTSAWMGSGQDPTAQAAGDREARALGDIPEGIGSRPIAPNAGEFDAIALNDDDQDEGAATEATGQPAPLTLVPTSTINPKRPRTVAAGYLPATKTLSVVFRDGTLYNYYEVTILEWANFKRARSKGRFILTYLDAKPRGYPEGGPMTAFARAQLEAVRTKQTINAGRNEGQSQRSRRGSGYGRGNLGGSTRGRR